MANAVKTLGFASKGRIVFDEAGRVAGLLAKLEGQRLEITLAKHSPRRNVRQNKKLWKTYQQGLEGMEEYSGHTKDEIHEVLKQLYCPETEIVLFGKPVLVKSTKLLTVSQMSAYIERAMAFFAQFGVEFHSNGMEVS